eukprot:scaffold5359_cov131-Isochrysis_galbana.AAC.1
MRAAQISERERTHMVEKGGGRGNIMGLTKTHKADALRRLPCLYLAPCQGERTNGKEEGTENGRGRGKCGKWH